MHKMGKTKRSYGKGFTVAELLIVVAIIAVLVAISIPVINKGLEKSREAYDIYTMRQAASAAIELYYAGVSDAASAAEAGMSWWPGGSAETTNAAGAYNPQTGTFIARRQDLPAAVQTYGKGTGINGKTVYDSGENPNGAYAPNQDYTNAIVMVAIYPYANPARVDVYWKNNSSNTNYVGGAQPANVPKYSLRINLN